MDLSTYLFFDGSCEEAFRRYAEVLRGEIVALMRYDEVPSPPPGYKASKRIIHASLKVGDRLLMGSDTPPAGAGGPGGGHGPERMQGFRTSISVDEPAEADRIFAALAEGGRIVAPIGETFFAIRFGMLNDRFGTPWMVNCPKPKRA